jgi:hypothetical protein
MRLAGCVASMRDMRNIYTILAPRPQGRDYYEDIGVDEGIIRSYVLNINCGCIIFFIIGGVGLSP